MPCRSGPRYRWGMPGITKIDAPRRAFARDAVPVGVRIGNRGRDGMVTISLVDLDDDEVLDSTEIELRSDQTEHRHRPHRDAACERIECPARVDGRFESRGTRIWFRENDLVQLDVEFVDRPLRVLYIEGYPRLEYRYLKNLLIREPSIESSVMLLSADREFAQEGNTPLARIPRTAEEFAEFDLIILGDLPSGFLTDSRQELIREQVARRGSGIVMIAGPRSMPSSWSGTPLADLLPFTGGLDLDRWGTGPVLVRPTDAATRLGVLRLVVGDDAGWPEALMPIRAYGWSQLQWVQRIERRTIEADGGDSRRGGPGGW